jgi:hypothetical protein
MYQPACQHISEERSWLQPSQLSDYDISVTTNDKKYNVGYFHIRL